MFTHVKSRSRNVLLVAALVLPAVYGCSDPAAPAEPDPLMGMAGTWVGSSEEHTLTLRLTVGFVQTNICWFGPELCKPEYAPVAHVAGTYTDGGTNETLPIEKTDNGVPSPTDSSVSFGPFYHYRSSTSSVGLVYNGTLASSTRLVGELRITTYTAGQHPPPTTMVPLVLYKQE